MGTGRGSEYLESPLSMDGVGIQEIRRRICASLNSIAAGLAATPDTIEVISVRAMGLRGIKFSFEKLLSGSAILVILTTIARLSCLCFTLTVAVASTPTNAVVRWNSATLQAIRDAKLAAPVSARALAIVHTCMYDTWVLTMSTPVGTQLRGALRRLRASVRWPTKSAL